MDRGKIVMKSSPQRSSGISERSVILWCLLFAPVIVLTGCGITQPLRPIEEGKIEYAASFGGPIIPAAGIAFPVPYLNVGMLYGLRPNMTVYGNAHLTAFLFKNVAVDGGFASRLLPEKGVRPEVTMNLRGYFFWDAFRGTTVRLYPMGSLIGSYSMGDRSLFYFGADDLYQVSTSEFFLSPFIGCSVPVSDAMVMQCESKWMAMNKDTRHGIFEGVASIGGNGNVGLFLGLQWRME